MLKYKFLSNLLPIVYPQFYEFNDHHNNELVLLEFGDKINALPKGNIDKTQTESFFNHFHLFGRFSKKNLLLIKEIGEQVAKNLLKTLENMYPEKKFIVFLDINNSDSTILRFHQIWDDEIVYYDITKFKNLFEYRTDKNGSAILNRQKR